MVIYRSSPTSGTSTGSKGPAAEEWTTIPVKFKPLVSFPKRPSAPTKHMLLLNSYFNFESGSNKCIWHCFLDDKDLSSNPRGHERHQRIQKMFTKCGHFFAEHNVSLQSLNVSSPRVVELFFRTDGDLWRADALVTALSLAMTGVEDRIRRKENSGKMVCHGVCYLGRFVDEYVGQFNLREERLRELEELNPVFDSSGNKVIYRIRMVHYMSSRAVAEQLNRTGATWAVTFSDFRIAECFIERNAEFNFFGDCCDGGLKWYQENGRYISHEFRRGGPGSPASSGGAAPAVVESSSTGDKGAQAKDADTVDTGKAKVQKTPEQAIPTAELKVDRSGGEPKLEQRKREEPKPAIPITTTATESKKPTGNEKPEGKLRPKKEILSGVSNGTMNKAPPVALARTHTKKPGVKPVMPIKGTIPVETDIVPKGPPAKIAVTTTTAATTATIAATTATTAATTEAAPNPPTKPKLGKPVDPESEARAREKRRAAKKRRAGKKRAEKKLQEENAAKAAAETAAGASGVAG